MIIRLCALHFFRNWFQCSLKIAARSSWAISAYLLILHWHRLYIINHMGYHLVQMLSIPLLSWTGSRVWTTTAARSSLCLQFLVATTRYSDQNVSNLVSYLSILHTYTLNYSKIKINLFSLLHLYTIFASARTELPIMYNSAFFLKATHFRDEHRIAAGTCSVNRNTKNLWQHYQSYPHTDTRLCILISRCACIHML